MSELKILTNTRKCSICKQPKARPGRAYCDDCRAARKNRSAATPIRRVTKTPSGRLDHEQIVQIWRAQKFRVLEVSRTEPGKKGHYVWTAFRAYVRKFAAGDYVVIGFRDSAVAAACTVNVRCNMPWLAFIHSVPVSSPTVAALVVLLVRAKV